ncbi:MAG: rod shape-determining protein MreD [Bacteroidaceae bacterium]|nr:rod shape-determining protein MreD [Bacteroidaceae bacterium]
MSLLTRTLWLILLVALQVLVFNHIHLFGHATPMPYIYLLLLFSSHTPRWVYVVVGFALGLVVDIFSTTLGAAAATTTLIGLLTPRALGLFSPDDKREEDFEPSARTMQWAGFMKFAALLTLVQTTVFFTIECFHFFHALTLLFNIIGSTLISLLIIAAIERIRMASSQRAN